MLRCKGCEVTVRGAPERCPLCQGQLEGAGEASAFPPGGEAPAPRLLFPLITLIAIIAGVTCVAVNFLAPGEAWWSLFALAGIGGAWVCVGIALRTRSNLLKNIVWQVFFDLRLRRGAGRVHRLARLVDQLCAASGMYRRYGGHGGAQLDSAPAAAGFYRLLRAGLPVRRGAGDLRVYGCARCLGALGGLHRLQRRLLGRSSPLLWPCHVAGAQKEIYPLGKNNTRKTAAIAAVLRVSQLVEKVGIKKVSPDAKRGAFGDEARRSRGGGIDLKGAFIPPSHHNIKIYAKDNVMRSASSRGLW